MSPKRNTIRSVSEQHRSEQHRSDRYRLDKALTPANGFGVPGPNLRTAIIAVRDPDPHGTRPLQVKVRLDHLEDELKHDRIDQGQYEAGRRLERGWENLTRIKGSSIWRITGRVDGSREGDAEVRMVAIVAEARTDIETAKRTIGEQGTALLHAILCEGRPLAHFASGPGERARSAVGAIFRWHLEKLADTWAARGPDRGRMRSHRAGSPQDRVG